MCKLNLTLLPIVVLLSGQLLAQSYHFSPSDCRLQTISVNDSLLVNYVRSNTSFCDSISQWVTDESLTIYLLDSSNIEKYAFIPIRATDAMKIPSHRNEFFEIYSTDYLRVYDHELGVYNNLFCPDSVYYCENGIAVNVETRSGYNDHLFQVADIMQLNVIYSNETSKVLAFSIVLNNNFKRLPPCWFMIDKTTEKPIIQRLIHTLQVYLTE